MKLALDLELGHASHATGRWAVEFGRLCRSELGYVPILYSYGSFVEACGFPRPFASLWLASYGRDDGKEHPFTIPHPWAKLAAHQFSSRCRIAGVDGLCDISHVYNKAALELPR